MKVKRISNDDVRRSIELQDKCWEIGEVYEVVKEDVGSHMAFLVDSPHGRPFWDYTKNWEVVEDE